MSTAYQCGNKLCTTPTSYDAMNAIVYANLKLQKIKCEAISSGGGIYQGPSGPISIGITGPRGDNITNIVWNQTSTSCSDSSYYCPDNLCPCPQGGCTFGENGCKQISDYAHNLNSTPSPPPCATGDLGCRDSNVYPYTEWRADTSHPNGGVCILGNPFFRRWCETPSSRSDSSVPGETNVTPFAYDPSSGNCYVTKNYCEHDMAIDCNDMTNPPDVCNTSPQGVSLGGCCDSCHVPAGQAFVEDFITGRTIFRGLKKLSDRRYKTNITLLGKDFAGKGVNLYLFNYIPDAFRKEPKYKVLNIGFMSDEVKKMYPKNVVKEEGIEYIRISLDDTKKTGEKGRNLKRMYNTYTYNDVALKMFSGVLPQLKKVI